MVYSPKIFLRIIVKSGGHALVEVGNSNSQIPGLLASLVSDTCKASGRRKIVAKTYM